MPNVDPSNSSAYMERLAASLDAQVRNVLAPLRFSDSPQMWSGQLDLLSSEIYRSAVQRTKETIRAVAQEFRGMDGTRCLLDGVRDAISRIDVLRSMLDAMDILVLPGAAATDIESDRFRRLQSHIPALRDSVNSIISHLSRWQDDFSVSQDVFGVLELPVATLESLLTSLSTSVPDAHIVRGRIVMQQLIALWNERRAIAERATRLVGPDDEAHQLEERLDAQRDIQATVMVSLLTLLEQLNEAPSTPVFFLDREILVCGFLGASEAFSRLRSQQVDIGQDISRMQRILDRLMDVVDG